MPGVLFVTVHEARNLPIMDRASELTDAFVEIKFGETEYKTSVIRKTLNPKWEGASYKFEVTDDLLQEDVLQFKVMDYDTYSSHDVIGMIYISLRHIVCLNPSAMKGWLPICDTIRGLRGEIFLEVRYEGLTDRKAICTAHNTLILSSPMIPFGYHAVEIYGFVEELVVEDDPEYEWLDRLRTTRTSNIARQALFLKLGNQLQTKIASKATEAGGNAVIGYKQTYDLEGGTGVVVRGIGTIVHIQKLAGALSPALKIQTPPRNPVPRRTSDLAEEGDKLCQVVPPSIELLEFPFFTLTSFPGGFVEQIAGIVTAHSVKLLSKFQNADESPERDQWWTELRWEVKSHALSLGCHAIIGYSETVAICQEVIVLTAIGTAAKIAIFPKTSSVAKPSKLSASCDPRAYSSIKEDQQDPLQTWSSSDCLYENGGSCTICHITYRQRPLPFVANLSRCCKCGKKLVPGIIFSTTGFSSSLIHGNSALITAQVSRVKKESKGEAAAREVGEALPFLEHDLHRQLLTRLAISGLNALANLKVHIEIGESSMLMTALATGCFLLPLPPPGPPQTNGESALQTQLNSMYASNRTLLHLEDISTEAGQPDALSSDSSEADSEGEEETEVNRVVTFTTDDIKQLNNFVPDVSTQNGIVPPPKYQQKQMICGVAWRPTTASDFPEQAANAYKLFRYWAKPDTRLLAFDCRPSLSSSKAAAQLLITGCVMEPEDDHASEPSKMPVTPLPVIPGKRIEAYHGNVNFFYIREQSEVVTKKTANQVSEVSRFVQRVLLEALAYMRSYARCLGAHALVSVSVSLCQVVEQGSQCQCLLNISADLVSCADNLKLPPLDEVDDEKDTAKQ